MKSVIALSAMVLLLALTLTVEAQPSYHQVPAAQYYYRAPRSVGDVDGGRVQRQAGGDHHHDVADFGAHTGHHGAFGWYADFPVHAHGN